MKPCQGKKGRKYAFTLKYDKAPTLSVLYYRVNVIYYFYTRVSFLLSSAAILSASRWMTARMNMQTSCKKQTSFRCVYII
jgi:hypothetical protein